jgi:predicted PurR-regulated permease PerM
MSDKKDLQTAEEPAARSAERLRTACLVLIAACAVGAALWAMKPVLAPLLIALFLFFLLRPAADAVARWRVSAWVSYPILAAAFLTVLIALGLLVESNVAVFEARLPFYRARLVSLLHEAVRLTGGAAAEKGFGDGALSLGNLFDLSSRELLHFAFGTTVSAVEMALMVVFYLFFIFLEVQKLPGRLLKALAPASADRALAIGRTIDVEIRRYLAVKTAVSFGMAAVAGLIGWAFGLDFWFLWAVLTFLANYVTYVGSVVACVPPIVVAYLQFTGPVAATFLAALIVANRLFWIDYIEIVFTGKRLNVSPLLLLFAIVALGALWGVVGMILSVPLVTAVRITLLSFEESKAYGVLMSED